MGRQTGWEVQAGQGNVRKGDGYCCIMYIIIIEYVFGLSFVAKFNDFTYPKGGKKESQEEGECELVECYVAAIAYTQHV